MNHKFITVNMLLIARVEMHDDQYKLFEGESGWNLLHPSGLNTYHLKSDLDVGFEQLGGCESVLLERFIKNLSVSTVRLLRDVWPKLTIGLIDHRVYTPNGYIEDVLDTRDLSTHYAVTQLDNERGLVTQTYPEVIVKVDSTEYNQYASMINNLLESQDRFESQYKSVNWYDLRLYGVHNESNLLYDMREYLKKHYPLFNAKLVKLPDLSSRLSFNNIILTCEHGGGGVIRLSTILDAWDCSNVDKMKTQLESKINFVAYLNRATLIERSLNKLNTKGTSNE